MLMRPTRTALLWWRVRNPFIILLLGLALLAGSVKQFFERSPA